jgi:hypothetical protein
MWPHELDLDLPDTLTFDRSDVPSILEKYVCAVCHSNLTDVSLRGRWRVMIVCPEHGNVIQVGRIRRSTVSIEMEIAKRVLPEVLINLSYLYGDFIRLIEQQQAKEEQERIEKNERTRKLVEEHIRLVGIDPVIDLTWKMWNDSCDRAREFGVPVPEVVREEIKDHDLIQAMKLLDYKIRMKRKELQPCQ